MLLEDVKGVMKENNVDDVDYVTHCRGRCSWDEFEKLMEFFDGDYSNYDKLDSSVSIVGKSGWWITYDINYSDEYYSQWTFHKVPQPGSYCIPPPTLEDFINKYT